MWLSLFHFWTYKDKVFLIRTAKAVAGAEPPKVRLKRQLEGEPELHADPKRPGEAD